MLKYAAFCITFGLIGLLLFVKIAASSFIGVGETEVRMLPPSEWPGLIEIRRTIHQ